MKNRPRGTKLSLSTVLLCCCVSVFSLLLMMFWTPPLSPPLCLPLILPQRQECPEDCSLRGVCFPLEMLAEKFGRTYVTPWDARKSVSCMCDAGFRGPACEQRECPTFADPLGGLGNEAARDCSGRGLCDYETGRCRCFAGFVGSGCQAVDEGFGLR